MKLNLHRKNESAQPQPFASAVKMVVVVIGLLLSINTAVALPSDSDQPINIDADRAERNDKTGVTIFSGNAKLKQGTLVIVADTITIHHKPEGVESITATGNPATLEQKPKIDKPTVKAEAKRIHYSVINEKIKLSVNAQIDQGDGSKISSDTIDYDLKDSYAVASGENRVKLIIQPQNKDTTNTNQ